MTVADAAAGGWTALAFILFITFILTDFRPAAAGCAACLCSLSCALCAFSLFVQSAAFFLYMIILCVLLLFRRAAEKRAPDGWAIVVKPTDADGGFVSYKGRLYPAAPRDPLYVYNRGDVCRVHENEDGTLVMFRP